MSHAEDDAEMRWFLLMGLLAALAFGWPAQAQSALDALPDCGFSVPNDSSGTRVGAVILNFETGAGCAQALDRQFNVASVPKLFVAGAYYDWMVRGLVTQNTPLVFSIDYYMGGSNDCLTAQDIGSTFRSRELIEYMINCSDNAATWMLMDAVGWGMVNTYVQSLGIAGIGTVVPYSEVDRLKLSMLDERWLQVPRALASRYYRSGMTAGLEAYFAQVPTSRLSREEMYEANSRYFLLYSTNTATPRALAEYFMLLRDALIHDPNSPRGLVAYLLFDVMLYTQRLNSVQGLDGTVIVGGKNGFDRGIVAEASLLFNDVNTRIPSGMVIVFTQQTILNGGNAQFPTYFRGPLNDYLRELSVTIRDMLYPRQMPPALEVSLNLSSLVVQPQALVQACWTPYFAASFAEAQVDALEACFNQSPPVLSISSGDNAALGLVLRGLGGRLARLVFVFTAPDGQVFSYQTDRQHQDKTAVYWYHPVTQAGDWQVDVYLNLKRVASQTFRVR
jgi:beta-lactamase class A